MIDLPSMAYGIGMTFTVLTGILALMAIFRIPPIAARKRQDAMLYGAASAGNSLGAGALEASTLREAHLIAQHERISALEAQIQEGNARERQLIGYLTDLGLKVDAMDDCGMWWSRARTALVVVFDESRLNLDINLSSDEQRLYASMLAKSVMKHPPADPVTHPETLG